MLSMVLSVLAPTLAQAAVAAAGKGQWVEVCSASGMVWLKTDAAETASPDQGTTMADMSSNCPWCIFHGSATGLPATDPATRWLGSSAQPVPVWAFAVAIDQAVWRHAQARAPPLAS